MKKKFKVFALCVVLFTLCVSVEAQQPRTAPKIGWLFGTSAASMASHRAEIFSLFRERGYFESKNIAFEYRYADNKLDRLPALADELVSLKVDVLVVRAPRPALAAKNATSLSLQRY
jgi:putative ABC transport system substrate-binding protein